MNIVREKETVLREKNNRRAALSPSFQSLVRYSDC
jgi:hypothetical protein